MSGYLRHDNLFSSYLDAWNGSPVSLNIPLQTLQSRRGLQRQTPCVPSSDLICTWSSLSCLYLPTSKLIILQTENPSDDFSVSHRLSPLLCLWPCCAPTRIHLLGLWNLKVLFTLYLFPEPPLPTRRDQAFISLFFQCMLFYFYYSSYHSLPCSVVISVCFLVWIQSPWRARTVVLFCVSFSHPPQCLMQ